MFNAIADAIQSFINSIYSHFMAFLTAMAAVGVITMAIIQTIKDMFPMRRAFQRSWLKRWFKCKASEFTNKTPPSPSVSGSVAEQDLVRLATDGNSNALYDLPIEQLCGQFNAAVQVALDYPAKHKDLLFCAASQASIEDLSLILNPPDAVTRPANPNAPPAPQSDIDQRQKFVDARNRVTHFLQRAIDAIQISAGFRWKLILQVASFALSALLGYLGVSLFSKDTTTAKFITAGTTAILAGFLAPVARDLVAALQQLRK